MIQPTNNLQDLYYTIMSVPGQDNTYIVTKVSEQNDGSACTYKITAGAMPKIVIKYNFEGSEDATTKNLYLQPLMTTGDILVSPDLEDDQTITFIDEWRKFNNNMNIFDYFKKSVKDEIRRLIISGRTSFKDVSRQLPWWICTPIGQSVDKKKLTYISYYDVTVDADGEGLFLDDPAAYWFTWKDIVIPEITLQAISLAKQRSMLCGVDLQFEANFIPSNQSDNP